jgi:hypothetical protein
MTTISPANVFGTAPSYGNYTKRDESDNSTTIAHDELIITQPEHSKTSRTSKNGRYISRLVDSIEKMQKKDILTRHDKYINTLSLYWYIRSLLLVKNSYDETSSQDKLFGWYDLLNKFDRESDDYGDKLNYMYNILETNLQDHIDELGIARENFMYKNFKEYDGVGFSTFAKDTWYNLNDLNIKSNIPEDKPESKLDDYPILSEESTIISKQPVPKILHIVYYKEKLDIKYLYVHLASYTANRDYKIMVWLPKLPEHQLRSNDHVEFKTFAELDVENYNREDNSKEWDWADKFKLKYYILKRYGGIYTNYAIAGVKKFSKDLCDNSFVSVFTTSYKEQRYICPLGFFMGFPPNHPFIDYILDNFSKGADICKTEYIYLRSALIKSQDHTIRLLNQIPNSPSNNVSYVVLRDAEYKKDNKYFDFADFDTITPDEPVEGSDDDKPTISTDESTDTHGTATDSTDTNELSEKDRLELESIENAVNTISKDTVNRSTSYTNYLIVFIIGLFCAYYAQF